MLVKLNLSDQIDKQYWLGLDGLSYNKNNIYFFLQFQILVCLHYQLWRLDLFGLLVSGFAPKIIYIWKYRCDYPNIVSHISIHIDIFLFKDIFQRFM